MAVPEVDIAEFAARREAGEPVLDVRTAVEYEQAHVPGVLLIPMDELVERVEEVPEDRVLVICATGARSAHAAEWLQRQGIDATNVAGGTVAWAQAGHPVETGAS
jgi:rhodanese-related sulfurtransferase